MRLRHSAILTLPVLHPHPPRRSGSTSWTDPPSLTRHQEFQGINQHPPSAHAWSLRRVHSTARRGWWHRAADPVAKRKGPENNVEVIAHLAGLLRTGHDQRGAAAVAVAVAALDGLDRRRERELEPATLPPDAGLLRVPRVHHGDLGFRRDRHFERPVVVNLGAEQLPSAGWVSLPFGGGGGSNEFLFQHKHRI